LLQLSSNLNESKPLKLGAEEFREVLTTIRVGPVNTSTACRLIDMHFQPSFLEFDCSLRRGKHQGQTRIARLHDIQRSLNPRLLSRTGSYDVASNTYQALDPGDDEAPAASHGKVFRAGLLSALHIFILRRGAAADGALPQLPGRAQSDKISHIDAVISHIMSPYLYRISYRYLIDVRSPHIDLPYRSPISISDHILSLRQGAH